MASRMIFNFENIREDQFRDVFERVKRDKRKKKDNTYWLGYLSRKNEDIHLKTDFFVGNLPEGVNLRPMRIERENIKKGQKSVKNVENEDCMQLSCQRKDGIVLLKNDTEVYYTLKKMLSLRQSVSLMLDSILDKCEFKMHRDNLFRRAPVKFEESEKKRRMMKYHCRILKLDYQLLMDIRKLDQNIAKTDLVVGILLKCHVTASKLLQLFTHIWCNLMKMNQTKKKFYNLLNSIIILNRACDALHTRYVCFSCWDILMVNVLNKKCDIILKIVDKEYMKKHQRNKCFKAEEKENEKKIKWSYKKPQSSKDIDLKKQGNIVSIPREMLRKIVENHFDCIDPRTNHERTAKVSKDKNSRNTIASSLKMDQRNEIRIERKKSVIRNIVNEENSRLESLSTKQDMPYLEGETKKFDVESFSKKLYIILEREICSNMKYIFYNFTFGNLQIYQTPGQNNDGQVVYHDKHLELHEKQSIERKSLHVPKEKMSKGLEFKSIDGREEVKAKNIDTPNQSEEILSFKTEDGFKAIQRCKSKVSYNHALPFTATTSSQKNCTVEPHKTNNSMGNKLSVEDKQKLLFPDMMRNLPLQFEPWDAIDRITEILLVESLKSISCQLDNCILKNAFDQEFLQI